MKRLSSEAECDAAKAMSDGAQTEWDAAKGKTKVPKHFSKMWYTKNDAVGVRHKCGAHRQIFHIRCSELSIDSLCDLDDFVLEGLNSGCMSEAKLFASSDPRKLIYFAGARKNRTQQSNTFAHSGSDIAPARLRCFIGRRKLFQLKCLQLRFFRVFASSLAVAQKTAARTNDRACGKGPFSGLEDDRVSQVPEREGQEQHRGVGQR